MDQKLTTSCPKRTATAQKLWFFVGPYVPLVGCIDPFVVPFICRNRPFIQSSRISAFTLIELLITLVVVAILAFISVPAINQFMHSNRLATATNDLIADLNLARSEAIKRSASVGVCKSNNQSTCVSTGTWRDGWLVFLDKDTSGTWSTGDEAIRSYQILPEGLTVTAAADLIIFNRQGLIGAGSGAYTLCNMKIQKSRELSLGPTGRIALAKKTC